jgi:excisionase family DNA binding protein
MMNEHITPSHLSPYLTLGEAAHYARCSTRTVQRWLSDKKLNRYGHGRHLLIRKAELEALLSTSQNT